MTGKAVWHPKRRDWNSLSNADVKLVSPVPREQVFACKRQVLSLSFFFFQMCLKVFALFPLSSLKRLLWLIEDWNAELVLFLN